jgi:hypothetical protein
MFCVAPFGGMIRRRATWRLSASAGDYPREVRSDRSIGAGSVGYRTVLTVAVRLPVAVAVLSCASDLELSGGYVVILPCLALLATAARPAGECDEAADVPVYRGIKAPGPCRATLEDRLWPALLRRGLTYRVLASRSL